MTPKMIPPKLEAIASRLFDELSDLVHEAGFQPFDGMQVAAMLSAQVLVALRQDNPEKAPFVELMTLFHDGVDHCVYNYELPDDED